MLRQGYTCYHWYVSEYTGHEVYMGLPLANLLSKKGV